MSWIVKSGFCSIHFTVTMAGWTNINRDIGNIIISKIVISAFHCSSSGLYACRSSSGIKTGTSTDYPSSRSISGILS